MVVPNLQLLSLDFLKARGATMSQRGLYHVWNMCKGDQFMNMQKTSQEFGLQNDEVRTLNAAISIFPRGWLLSLHEGP